MIPFSQQLQATRAALGMTQDALAVLLDVDKQTVSNWECGRTTPWPKKQVEVLSRLLDLAHPVPAAPQINYVPTAPVRARVIDRI